MSQINWNDFTPVDENGAPTKPAQQKQAVNWDDFTPAPEPAGVMRKVGDLGISLAKGVVGVPEAAVGLLDIPTGGAVGKFLENEGGAFGFRPKQAKEYLSSFQSDDLQAKQKQFQDADGVLNKAGVAISNPSLIVNAITETAPSIGAGGVVSRGLMAAGARGASSAAGSVGPALPGVLARTVGEKAAPRVAGALGEGVVGAGSAAESIRQETQDGLLTPTQSALAAGSGLATAVFGYLGGKAAERLGIGDLETMIAKGAAGQAPREVAKSIPRQVIEGAISEGLLEELPQSVSEQVLQNLALNKPWHEGVEDAAVMGTLAGMAMGGGAAGYSGLRTENKEPPPEQPPAPTQNPAPGQPPASGPTLALPAPDPGVIQVGADATARTPPYQVPPYVGDVTDVEPKPVNPVREQVAAAAEQGGALSAAALTAIDAGVTESANPGYREIDFEDADPHDQAIALQFFKELDLERKVEGYLKDYAEYFAGNDDDIPDFGAPSNATTEQFLRAMGASEEEIQDAVATSRKRANAQSNPSSNVAAPAYEPADPRQSVGASASRSETQVAPRQPDNFTGTPTAAMGQPGATVSAGPGFGLKDALAQIRARKQQEASNAQDAQAAPAATEAPGAAPAAGPAPDIKAITGKLIPDMTDAELQVAIEHYGPAHKRTAKLQKEVQRRAAPAATTIPGVTNGHQAPQAQQASPQPAQAGAAPAAGPATGNASAADPTGTPEVRALTDGAQAQNTGAQAAPAAGPQGATASTQAPDLNEVGARWTRMTSLEREGALKLAGWRTNAGGLNVVGKRLLRTSWGNMVAGTQDTLARAMSTRAEVGGNPANGGSNRTQMPDEKAQNAIKLEADQIAEAVSKADRLDLKGAERAQWVAESLSGIWAMTPDEVRDVPEVAAALRKKPSKEDATAASVRAVEQVMRQAEQAAAINSEAAAPTTQSGGAEQGLTSPTRAQPGEPGYTLLDARNDLIELRTREASQGAVVDDRLLQRIREQEKLVAKMERQGSSTNAEKPLQDAQADQVPSEQAQPASAPSDSVVNVPPAIAAALDADMQAQKARVTRLRNEAAKDGTTLEEKTRAQTQLKGAEFTLQTMRRTRFDAEDAAIKAIEQKDMAPFAEHITFFKTEKALQELIGAAQAPAPAAAPKKVAPKNKPNADQTRAKADLMAALADLGDILGKNTRMNIMPEQEQKLLPVLTRVLDAAFRLGYHKFKDSAKFALDQIRTHLGDEAADALTLDHLQGAYIAMAGGKQNADTKRTVIDVESKADIEAHEATATDDEQEPAADKRTLTHVLRAELAANRMPKDNPALKRLVEAFDGKPADQNRMKQAQESLESAIVQEARARVEKLDKEGLRTTFNSLVSLYESQPLLNVRTSTSIANQAYSTPAPLAYLASKLAGINQQTRVHEPTGGTGMLLIGADPQNTVVNELNDLRVSLLKEQGFNPTQKDAAIAPMRDGKGPVDAVITNPPFGSVKGEDGKPIKVKVDGYNIGQIDHLIAAHALDTMKDDGRAVLILGGNKAPGGLSTDDRIFFNWLYSHYNVTGHFEVEGDLYVRQGAGWPVRVIVINGREKSAKLSPVAGTIKRVDNWDQVYEQFNQILGSGGQSVRGAGAPAVRAGSGQARPGNLPAPARAEATGTGGQRPEAGADGDGNVNGARAGTVADRTGASTDPLGHIPDEQRLNGQSFVPPGLDATRPDPKPAAERPAKPAGAPGVAAAPADTAGNEFQTAYVARSARKDEGVLIPSNMAQPTQDALNRLEDEVGDIDEFARKELGYKSVEALHNALMGLQVDSVATAIHQIKKGKAVVIADQTGIGKGRQAASIIRWAARNGMTPVFVSVKPSLFTDMYGDLADIGTHDVAPFILNSDAWVSGDAGEKLFANKPSSHRAAVQSIVDNGKLPEGRNALFMTYSQINTANLQRQALMALAGNAVFVLDESHNAAGASGTGEFMIGALAAAKGVTYLSATYAKRPDNMPLYFKTDIGDAAADSEGLADAMAAGGLPLQTVVSNNLVKAGQMFRRERSYDGVSIASTFDTENRVLHERLSDEATQALRAIVSADKKFHSIFVKTLDKQLKQEGSQVQDSAGNQVSAGVQHTEFSSVVHNFVRQMLLGLKAQTAADEAVASLKRGEKPIIAVENTMGSFLSEYAAQNGLNQGDSLGAFDYRTVLSRALERSRVIIEVSPTGDKVKKNIPLSKLDPITRKAYDDAQAVIDALVIDIPVSPIDWMRAEIARAGFSVAEITGRDLSVDYSNPRKPVLAAIDLTEQRDKVASTRKFNGGELDALILNVAGSTGISLHASEKFQDQRQRHMIVAQAAGDINIFMQMLGRVHRTGQVRLPKYTILSVDLPTEKRPTAVLSRKMKSLNANTSSNTESATSVKTADILNKYGDQIVNQYLWDNLDLAIQLNVVDLLSSDGDRVADDIARKATGRLALQPIEVQRAFYEDVEAQYDALIEYLNKTNQNDLEPRTFDFDAKETRQELLFEGPNKATPFGEDAVYGEYSIKAQGAPMKPAEIRAAMAENLGGLDGAGHANKLVNDLLQTYADQINANRAKNGLVPGNFDEDKAAAYVKGIYGEARAALWVQDAKNSIAAGKPVTDLTPQELATAQSTTDGIEFIRSHAIGTTFRVDINSEPYNAVVTNVRSTHKTTGNPFSLSKIQLTVAVNGALRSITVPATQFRSIEVSRIARTFTVESLFKEQPPNQRETAKIVTGNLLAAYGEIKGVRGTIISFTKADGVIEQGILLPKLFDFSKNTQGDYRLRSGADALKFLQQSTNKDIGRFGIATRDGQVRVLPRGNGIQVRVPKSKQQGARYFLDKKLIDVGGDFVSSANAMVANVDDASSAEKMLDLLMDKQALYALPSMADEAKSMASPAASFSRTPSGMTPEQAVAALYAQSPALTAAQRRQSDERMTATQSLVDDLKKNWAKSPKIIVARNMDDPQVPQAVRDYDAELKSRGSEGEARGFIHKGTVYLLSDQLQGPQQIAETLFHEVLGHFGLRGAFGDGLKAILQQMGTMRRRDVLAKAREYGMVDKSLDDAQAWAAMSEKVRLDAAEEVLAEMAQSTPEIGFVQRAIAAIRTWLRANVPGFKNLALTDAEIVRSYILPARGFVTRSSQTPQQSLQRSLMPAFGRGSNDGTSENDADLKAVEQAYGGRPAWEKAKAEGKTKLTYGQWLQVRTPKFKAWFGDWEIAAAAALRDAQTFEQARAAARDFQGKPLTNLATGINALVSRNSLDKMLSSKAVSKSETPQAQALAVANLDELFARALLGWSKQDVNGDPNIRAIHRFFAPVVRDGRAMLAKMTVKETAISGDPNPLYTVETVEFNEKFPAAQWVAAASDADGVDLTSIRSAGNIESLAKRVQNFNPATVSKAIDPQTGEPLVVYHGTAADVEFFDPLALGANTRAQSAKGGFFFAASPKVASGYAILSETRPGLRNKILANAANSDVLTPDLKQMLREASESFTWEDFLNGTPIGDMTPGANVLSVYASIKNPLIVDYKGESYRERSFANWIKEAKEAGNDGVIFRNAEDSEHKDFAEPTDIHVAFTSTQIKSATGNNGNFDPEDRRINFSRSKLTDLKNGALDRINQAMSYPGKVSLWDKTVGTMRHLAERAPAFKPVFEAAQRFIDDVSTLANEAADAAPRLLPRIESLSDLKKKPISAEDNKAIARPLFEGTLLWGRDSDGKAVLVDDLEKKYANLPADDKAQMMLRTGRLDAGVLRMWRGLPLDQYESAINTRFQNSILKPGVVWTEQELQSLFNATPKQISLYQEARAAIDRSIDLTARADMLRLLGAEYAPMRDAVMDAPLMTDALTLLVDTLEREAQDAPDQRDRLAGLMHQLRSRHDKAQELIAAGYAPLSRFGRHTVDVMDANGERQYFGMFESAREANLMAMKMRDQYKGATVKQGTKSQEEYKLLSGITPESLELFGNMLGLDADGNDARDKAFQDYLKLTKNNHSALKRLIHRKGIAGYSEDVGRVLASFVYSNARQAAGGLNAGTMETAISKIPQGQGELKDVAMGLREYIRDPQEEGQAIRGMLFAQYLGGSVASAFVNMTQPFAVTMPYLSQFGGMKKAAAQMARAVKDIGNKTFKGEPDLARALHQAVEDGTVAPQEIHQLMAQARGTGSLRVGDGTKVGDARAAAANNWERVKVAWGQPFALAEQFNRRATFIAAFRMAKEQGNPNPAEFARKAVLETQFLYSKANKAQWARGAVGGTLMTFKTYSVSYLELLQRTWNAGKPRSPERAAGRRAVAWAVVMLLLMGGAGGLPFAEDLEDLIDGAGQLMGYNMNSKQWRKELMREVLGQELGDFVNTGVSGLPGAPIDVSGRLGMGNLIPGTGLLLSKQNRERDLLEIAGPAGDLVSRGFTGARKLLTGDLGGAALEVSPSAVRNAAKGIDMAASGIYKDDKGYKVLDTTLPEAAAKFIGFQPRSVAKVQEANSFMLRSKAFYAQTSSEIKAEWAKALFEKDEAGVQRARERVAEWNRDNPDQRMTVQMPDIWKRVREMGKDRTQRIADTAPKALRDQMRQEVQRVREPT